MDDPDYGEPLFGFIEDFQGHIDRLGDENMALRDQVHRLECTVRGYQRDCSRLREEIKECKQERKSERERLTEWLDRRLVQQEQAMTARFVSNETKRVMEIEVAMLKRYREIIVGSAHTKGTDDPLMPRFE